MSRHLSACAARKKAIENAEAQLTMPEELHHLRVQAARPEFWLDLEMRGSSDLGDLDAYLRSIWLECCGHMSQFSVGGWRGDEIDMNMKVSRVFRPGVELTHLYDFGTTSVTLIKLAETRKGKPLTSHPIVLMARNLLPSFQCVTCGEPATWLCQLCDDVDEDVLLCHVHAPKDVHWDEGALVRIVNSPRCGMCGYDGPAIPLY
jgi:hypothetical protein